MAPRRDWSKAKRITAEGDMPNALEMRADLWLGGKTKIKASARKAKAKFWKARKQAAQRIK